MKNKSNKKFRPALIGTLGAVLSFFVTVLMVTGDFQEVVHFRGVGEEIVFTIFVLALGIISLGMAISCLSSRE